MSVYGEVGFVVGILLDITQILEVSRVLGDKVMEVQSWFCPLRVVLPRIVLTGTPLDSGTGRGICTEVRASEASP